MAESLRVDRGIRRIEVNDEGEYLEITLNDPTFFSRFADFLKWLESSQTELESWDKEYRGKYEIAEGQEQDADIIDVEAISEYANKHVDLCKETCIQLDQLFGTDSCRKVFGNMLPDEYCISDFLEKLTPIMQRMAKERDEKIQLRYDGKRKGARSIPYNRQQRRSKKYRKNG